MLKIGIVGTGNVAVHSYLPYLVAHEQAELSYYNRTPSKSADTVQRFGGRAVDSLKELVAAEPDTILVLTPETVRDDVALQLLEERPKRLFFEKPLVAKHGQANVTEEDFRLGQGMLLKAREVGCETAMVFNYRYFSQVVQARQLVENRALGKLMHVTALVHYACWSHCIDLIGYFGGPIATLTALASAELRGKAGGEQAADVAASFRMQNGATGTIIGTLAIDFAMPLFEIILAYEHGRLALRDLDGDLELVDYRCKRIENYALSRNVSRWDQYNATFAASLKAYLATVRAGTPPPIPGVAGLAELQVEAAMKRSIRELRPVVLVDEFPLEI
ncbi:MAG: Gfo/Idh/MocA family oxidoreductase [Chloroflexi bacterium]|nr:Gfo/Idh/MocA family oxidoreductase [Chloroflexota bacterium]